jgi:uncharacterized protein YycO
VTPQAGDYFVVATNGVVARLIRWFTGSWANHCGICLGGDLIVEANPGGVAVGHLSAYAGDHIAWSRFDLTEKEVDRMMGACQVMLGIPYSFKDIAALVLRRWGVRWWAAHRLARGDRLICSQLVVRAYRAAGFDLVANVPDNWVTPGDLAAVLEEATTNAGGAK